jgi:four helix bundle protein
MQSYNSKFKSDLKQRCFEFSLNIIKLMDNLPHKRSAWVISDQLIRSSTSIGANLVEARASSSRLEYKKFYEIALKSANETVYWLELLKDSGIADSKDIEPLLIEVKEISNMLGAGVIKLKNKNF